MIRKATQNDAESIFNLYQHHSLDISRAEKAGYAANVQHDGFVITLEGKEEIAQRIEKNFLFKVYEENGKILGFININKEIYFPEHAGNIIWFDEALKKLFS